MRPIRGYAATFEAINQYHLTPKWKAKLIGTIGHVNRTRPHKTGCGDRGIAKLRITQTPATMKPTRAHSPILRFMVSHLSLSYMLRLDDSPGQLVGQFGQLTPSRRLRKPLRGDRLARLVAGKSLAGRQPTSIAIGWRTSYRVGVAPAEVRPLLTAHCFANCPRQ
jgi:hypothetical protein